MSHRYHPNPEANDDPEAILFNDCADCGYKARNFGLDLDTENWMRMWDRMLEVELSTGNDHYRSEPEALLGKYMYRMYVALERYTTIDPKTLFAPWKLV
jgi:hypothetical protein